VATTHTNHLLAAGEKAPAALTSGFSLAFWAGAGFAGLSILATLFALRREDLVLQPGAEPAAEAAG
jgi:hypothetical protein